jgi:hypothetical protein
MGKFYVFDKSNHGVAWDIYKSIKHKIEAYGCISIYDVCALLIPWEDETEVTFDQSLYGWKNVNDIKLKEGKHGTLELAFAEPKLLWED